jgi:hypothetical protein
MRKVRRLQRARLRGCRYYLLHQNENCDRDSFRNDPNRNLGRAWLNSKQNEKRAASVSASGPSLGRKRPTRANTVSAGHPNRRLHRRRPKPPSLPISPRRFAKDVRNLTNRSIYLSACAPTFDASIAQFGRATGCWRKPGLASPLRSWHDAVRQRRWQARGIDRARVDTRHRADSLPAPVRLFFRPPYRSD